MEERVPLKMKLGYGVGDFGANLMFQPVMLFLMYFFTDVFLISASAASLVFLVSKIWDGVSDPMVGFLSDRTRTRWGRKRPYLLFGAVPLGLSFFLLFAGPGLEPGPKVFYALAMFLFFCTAYTVVNIPYAALTADMTRDSHERSKVTGYRMFFAITGTLLVAGATKPLVGLFSSEATGWRIVAVIYGLAAAALTLVTFFSVREKTASIDDYGQKLKDLPRVLLDNPPFLILCLGMFLQLAAISIIAAMVNYYFKYVLDREAFVSAAFLCLFVPAALSLPLWVLVSKRWSKKTAFNLGMGLLAASLGGLYFVRDFSAPLMIALFAVGGLGMSTIYLSPWSMAPDTVEYLEWRTGQRREGVIYGFFCFIQKLGAAFGGFTAGQGLHLAGYIPNVPQSESSLMGIKMLLTVIPIGIIVLGILVIRLYPIDESMHRKMLLEIKEKKAG